MLLMMTLTVESRLTLTVESRLILTVESRLIICKLFLSGKRWIGWNYSKISAWLKNALLQRLLK